MGSEAAGAQTASARMLAAWSDGAEAWVHIVAVSEDGVPQTVEEVPYYSPEKLQVHTTAVNPTSLRQHIMTPRLWERYM